MSQSYISKALRELVAIEARSRCGYCLSAEHITGTPMEIDHLVPEALGGKTEQDNLWLACSWCNAHKADRIMVVDPVTDEMVQLFITPARKIVGRMGHPSSSGRIANPSYGIFFRTGVIGPVVPDRSGAR